jgi:endo-1,4-beta-xylanase
VPGQSTGPTRRILHSHLSASSTTMLSIATVAVGCLASFAAFADASPKPNPGLEARQNSISYNAIQNWANDFADVDFRNNAGGNFNVTWDNNPGGNFVVGKGVRPGRDM